MESDNQQYHYSSPTMASAAGANEEWKDPSIYNGNNPHNNAISCGAKYVGDVKDTQEFQFFHFDQMPTFSVEHTSMMAKILTPQLFYQLKDLRTSNHFTLSNVITPGILDPRTEVGVATGDEECWTLYKDLLFPIIKLYHRFEPYYSKQRHDLDLSKISFTNEQLELFNRHIVFSKLSLTRNVAGYAYPTANSLPEREHLERIIIQSCHTLQDNYPGVYFPLEVLTAEQQQTLYNHGFLPHVTPYLTQTGASRDWPYHRGVYLSHEQNIILWLNEEHHCRIFSQQMNGNIVEIFRQLHEVDNLISAGLQTIPHGEGMTTAGYQWAWHPQIGYLSSSPASLGTGLLFSIYVSLPEFSKLYYPTDPQAKKDSSMQKILLILCVAYDMMLCPSQEPSNTFTLFNQHLMGLSEIQILQSMIDGITKLLQYEELLGNGVHPTIVCEIIRRELASSGRYAFSKEESAFSGSAAAYTATNTVQTTGEYYINEHGEMVAIPQPSPMSHDYNSPYLNTHAAMHAPDLASMTSPMHFPMQMTTQPDEDDFYNDPNFIEPHKILCPYRKHQIESVSYKPILSVGNYVSLDIECIVAGCSDRKIRFYDSQTMEEVASTVVEKKNVNFVAISEMSPEGDDPVIVTGGKDSSIQVWNPMAGNIDKSITLPTMEVRSISIYQGSVHIYAAIGTKDGKVFVWDVKENKEVVHFPGHKASVHCVCIQITTMDISAYDDDLKYLCVASGSADRTARTWNVKTSMQMKRFHHQRSISSILITNKGSRPLLVTAGVERTVKLWDLTSGILLRVFLGHLDQINSLALWEGCQMLLISGSSDSTIRIYDMLTGENIVVLTGHRDAVLSLTVANMDQPTIVSSSEDLSLIQWDLGKIIEDYYITEDGENAGMRNERVPELPTIFYRAPEELDRSVLSKEERKRIRRERKKQQRLKNLLNDWKAFKSAAVTHTTTTTTGEQTQQDEIELNAEDLRKAAIAAGIEPIDEALIQQEILQLQESIDRENAWKNEEKQDLSAHEPPTMVASSSTASMHLPRTKSQVYFHTLKTSSQSLIDMIMQSAMRKVVPSHNHHEALIQQSTSASRLPTVGSSSSLSSLKKALGFTATVAVEPFPPINTNTTHTIHNTIQHDHEHIKQQHHKKPFPEHQPPQDHGVSEAKETMSLPTKKNWKPSSKGEEHQEDTTTPLIGSPTFNARKRTTSSSSAQGGGGSGEHEELSFKLQAQATQSKYNTAVVEHTLETDRKRNAASEKLALRLQLKKKLHQEGDDPTATSTVPLTPTTASTKGSNELTEQQLHDLKAQKLKQHKMQEIKRHQSMAMAKQRSANALQKRLEDLANKKKAEATNGNGNESNRARTKSMVIEEGDEEMEDGEDGEAEMD